MRDYPLYNFPAFDKMAELLAFNNWRPISPAELDRVHENWGYYPPPELEITPELKRRCILRDVVALLDCEAIVMLKGWRRSRGAWVEYMLARFLGLEVYFE